MHIYFFSSLKKSPARLATGREIREALEQTDVWVSSNTASKEIQASEEVLAEAAANDTPLMNEMDAFIIEGTEPAPEVGFLVAQAMASKKPTLYLFERGTVPELFSHVNRQELPKFITIVAYQPGQAAAVVRDYLPTITGQKVKEVPRIKFTLRLTATEDEYLDVKTRNTKTTKADFLRDHLDRLIESDHDWLAWKKKRRQQEK